jgi:hypothetical protein
MCPFPAVGTCAERLTSGQTALGRRTPPGRDQQWSWQPDARPERGWEHEGRESGRLKKQMVSHEGAKDKLTTDFYGACDVRVEEVLTC